MQAVIAKRSIVIAGRKTSVSLEDAFWNGLREIGRSREVTLSELIGGINVRRADGNLSSAIRLFVLDHYQSQQASTSAMRSADVQQRPHQPSQANGGVL